MEKYLEDILKRIKDTGNPVRDKEVDDYIKSVRALYNPKSRSAKRWPKRMLVTHNSSQVMHKLSTAIQQPKYGNK